MTLDPSAGPPQESLRPVAPPPLPPPLPPSQSGLNHPAVRWVWSGFTATGKLLASVARFYWGSRQNLWKRFATGDSDPREVELAAEKDYKTAHFDETGWTVTLPDCCVVCGNPADTEPVTETRHADDLSMPLWMPVGGAIFSLVTLFFSVWLMPVPLVLGFVLGYAARRRVAVRCTLRRCEPHAAVGTVPRVRLVGDGLVLGFGQKRVAELFQETNRVKKRRKADADKGGLDQDDADEPPPKALTGWEAPEIAYAPTSIPLDDEPMSSPWSNDASLPLVEDELTSVHVPQFSHGEIAETELESSSRFLAYQLSNLQAEGNTRGATPAEIDNLLLTLDECPPLPDDLRDQIAADLPLRPLAEMAAEWLHRVPWPESEEIPAPRNHAISRALFRAGSQALAMLKSGGEW